MDKIKYMLPVEEVDLGAMEQLEDIASKDFVKKIVVYPDVHKGYGVPIGAVVLMEGVISPMAVGYDIYCGVHHVTTNIKVDRLLETFNLKMLEELICSEIPMGGRRHENAPVGVFESASGDKELNEKVGANALKQSGTLGGKTSNHFIEVGVVESKNVIGVTIHSGSRNPGYCIAEYYLKKYGDYLELNSPEGEAYYQDTLWVKSWARLNRIKMMTNVLRLLGLSMEEMSKAKSSPLTCIDVAHNFVEITPEGVLHRKGATPAHAGQLGLIPGNMRDGVYIVRGLGNDTYLNSCSHGAGRLLGRNQAKKTLSLASFEETMSQSGIVAKVSESTLDESPDCYKPIDQVIAYQEGIVIEVVDHIRPLLNVKG